MAQLNAFAAAAVAQSDRTGSDSASTAPVHAPSCGEMGAHGLPCTHMRMGGVPCFAVARVPCNRPQSRQGALSLRFPSVPSPRADASWLHALAVHSLLDLYATLPTPYERRRLLEIAATPVCPPVPASGAAATAEWVPILHRRFISMRQRLLESASRR